MQPNQTSRTAEYMAFFRAVESLQPPGRRMVVDPFASAFLSPGLNRAVSLSRFSPVRTAVISYVDRRIPGARTSAIARTRIFDEVHSKALASGLSQEVILGAGFDCRAYRLGRSEATTVFEVDHPAMSALKQARIAKLMPRSPENVRFVAIDFNRESLGEALGRSGFNRTEPALFIWEGVTNYLDEDAVAAVLGFVGSCAPGSRIAFTYVHKGALDGSANFYGAAAILRDVAALGEPWTFGLAPDALPQFLARCHLQLESDWGADEYRQNVYGERAKRMRGYEFYRICTARIAD
jgi:methyltransferase (TIGR00027 family)